MIASAALLTLTLVGCGKKEDEGASAPAATSAPATTAPAVDTANAGSVSGTVKLEGAAPKPHRINMAADAYCNSQHASGATDQEVVVDGSGDLANVIVYVKDGLPNQTFNAPKEGATLDQKGCEYTPHVVALMAGQELIVINSDKTTHNIHPTPKVNRDWNKSQSAGQPNIVETFPREEVAIPVKCNIHPWMKSYIAVFKHPYYNVTGANGSFDLKNLPPGTYTLEAWHEKYGTSDQTVTIGPKEAKKVSFTFKSTAAAD
jgi:plastocyanin